MIYVHVPFCRSWCRYCAFYSETACGGGNVPAWENRLLDEIAGRRGEIEDTLGLNTLYIGGGTPSVLPLSSVESIVRTLDYGPYEEFTVEVNPEDIVEKGSDYVRGLLDLGVNRISMGVQSLSDDTLRWMRRRHDAERARRAFGILRDAGARNVSVDLIYGINGDGSALESARELVSWAPEHISAYQLSVDEGSALSDSDYVEEDENECRRQYLDLCSLLRGAGYVHYEISNWAKPGFLAVHNSAYWERRPYVGLGPGAHSFDGKTRRSWNTNSLTDWTSEYEILGPDEVREETVMLSLRTAKGYNGRVLSEEEWFVSDSIIVDIL